MGGPPPGRQGVGNRILIISLVLVMIAAAAIAIGIVASSFLGGDEQAGGTVASPSPSASPASESPEPSPEASSGADELINPGWKLATAEYYDFYYEVPYSGWTLLGAAGVSYGFDEDGDEELDYTWEGPTVYQKEPCEGWSSYAAAGAFGVLDSTDTEDSAPKVAERWGELQWGREEDGLTPATEVRSVEPLEVNGLSGHLAIVDVTAPAGLAECAPESGVVYTAAFKDEERAGRLRTLSVTADVGVSEELGESRIDKIIRSVRDISA